MGEKEEEKAWRGQGREGRRWRSRRGRKKREEGVDIDRDGRGGEGR